MTPGASGRLERVALLALGLAACGGGGGGESPTEYTLSVQQLGSGHGTVTGGGITCGTTCSVPLAAATTVTLTAAADAGSTFAGWSGCDGASGTTCNVTMSADRIVTATFAPAQVRYTLSVQKVGGGSGTVTGGEISCGTTCSASLAAGTAVTLTAAAHAGSTFAGWSGCDGASGTTCNVTMAAERTVTATFDAGSDLGSLSVTNFHCLAVDELHIRRSSSLTWSADLLASPLAPGATFTLTDLPVGTYDAYAVATIDGNSWTLNGIGITVGGTFPWSIYMPAGTGCLTLVNNAEPGATILSLYLPLAPSGCTGNAWGTELLAGSTIPPGGSFTFSNLPQGPHDIWALTDAEPYKFCAVSVSGGSNTYWYLTPP